MTKLPPKDPARVEANALFRLSEEQSALRRRLSWQYGPDRAADIIAGRDPETNADVARWDRLGRKDET